MVKKKAKKWQKAKKSEIEDEFYNLMDRAAAQHDIDVICEQVPYKNQKDYVIGYHEFEEVEE